MVTGRGRIDGRPVGVIADDFTVRGGAADAAIWQKMVQAEKFAGEYRMPLIRMVDGTGGGGSRSRARRSGTVDCEGQSAYVQDMGSP
jgi:propionyl-CoA carboxylase beta chain